MLNYIKAELYKTVHRNYLWIFLCVMLVLETLFALLWVGRREFADMAALMTTTMAFGPYLTVLLADIVVADPYRTGTMKNEVSFGVSRSTIYLGKLWSAVIVSVIFCAVLFAFYLGGCWLFTEHSEPEAIRTNLSILGYVTAASVPLWLGTLGLSVACFLTIRSELAAGAAVMLFLAMGEVVLDILSGIQIEPVKQIASALQALSPSARFGKFQSARTWELMAQHWWIGLGWLAVSTGIGLAIFRRREIR